jgi:hypothetical protein
MKNTSSFDMRIFGITLGLLAVTMPVARAQNLHPLNDNPGTECLQYDLDVMSLKSNNVQMFWKQSDCIIVHVTNNPFLFKYELKFDGQLIKEDDPLAAFGGKFGLDVSSVGNSGSAHQDATPKVSPADKAPIENAAASAQDSIKRNTAIAPAMRESLSKQVAAFAEMEKVAPLDTPALQQEEAMKTGIQEQIKAVPKLSSQQRNNLVDSVEKIKQARTLQTLPTATPPVPVPDLQSKADKAKTEADAIQKALNEKKNNFDNFSKQLPDMLTALTDQTADSAKITRDAKQLYNQAQALLIEFPKGAPDFPGADGLDLEGQMQAFAKLAAPLHAQLNDAIASGTAREIQVLVPLRDALDSEAGSVVHSACTYKALRDNDFTSLRTRIMDPINKILLDGLSFGYTVAAKRRVGPFGDPTAVTMTLKRDPVSPFNTSSDDPKKPKNTTTSFSCSSDATDMFEHGAEYNTFDDFFSDKPLAPKDNPSNKRSAYTKNQNSPKPVPMANQPTTQAGVSGNNATKTATDDNTVLVQPWFFGKARLVVSGGLSAGFLTKTEFQRSNSISGTGSSATSSAVIGLKTDSRSRFTPMLYGHTYLYSRRHDPDAFYATFGVTANSDNKGTDPEFLVGLSRSIAQQKFFITAGAYIGERQKLDGGLHVGDTIPSSLTGELPVTKSYHVGWAFGLSYRFTSSKDPQKESTTAAKPSSGSSK